VDENFQRSKTLQLVYNNNAIETSIRLSSSLFCFAYPLHNTNYKYTGLFYYSFYTSWQDVFLLLF